MDHMKPNVEREDLLRRYLLGMLPDASQEDVEQRLMTDPEFMKQLGMIEVELADDYAAGILRGAEKEHFERVFMAHRRRREQVAFAQALHTHVDRHKSRASGPVDLLYGRRGLPAWALAAACLILAVGVAGLTMQVMWLHRELDRVTGLERNRTQELQQERTERLRVEQELTALKTSPSTAATSATQSLNLVAMSLLPGLARDVSELPLLRLDAGKDAARLELLLENGSYPIYEAALQTEEGGQVFSQTGLRPSQASSSADAVVLLLPRGIFKAQNYVIRLAGIRENGASEPAGSYHFRVVLNRAP